MRSPPSRRVLAAVLAIAATAALACGPHPTAEAADARRASGAPTLESTPVWIWPLQRFRLVEPYVAPAHRYAPGHRGIDLEPLEAATVSAPASGTVAFSGSVAGRGILTIDHGGGLVTTLEPVDSALPIGTAVAQGDGVATVALGGHTQPGAVHFGVRLDGEYINPMTLLGGVPRAVLLPCC